MCGEDGEGAQGLWLPPQSSTPPQPELRLHTAGTDGIPIPSPVRLRAGNRPTHLHNGTDMSLNIPIYQIKVTEAQNLKGSCPKAHSL